MWGLGPALRTAPGPPAEVLAIGPPGVSLDILYEGIMLLLSY